MKAAGPKVTGPAGYRSVWRRGGYSFPGLAGILWKLLIDAHDAAAASCRLPCGSDRTKPFRRDLGAETPAMLSSSLEKNLERLSYRSEPGKKKASERPGPRQDRGHRAGHDLQVQ
jgi:hypothetical protein